MALAVKRRTQGVRGYYHLWQREAAKRGGELDRSIGFDIVHHATFSAYWLPMGVAKIPKPLVVGPVAGGALTPSSLLQYLSARDLLADGLRSVMSHTLGALRRSGLQHRGAVVIAQEHETASLFRRGGRVPVIVHSNASEPWLPELSDIKEREGGLVFVGRLLSWKGTSLAIAALRCAETEATLTFIGDGRDRRRLERQADKLGLADRVIFTGPVSRDEALRRMRRAVALLFPSFHDSAAFCVSEALSMGTPVICLDHAGPGVLTRLWPGAPHAAVEVRSAAWVVSGLASAIDGFVRHPRPLSQGVQQARTSLAAVVGQAYERALS